MTEIVKDGGRLPSARAVRDELRRMIGRLQELLQRMEGGRVRRR